MLFKYVSQHLANEVVDKVFSVTPVSASLDGVPLGDEASTGWGQLEWPQEIVSFLEVWTNGVNLVNEILDVSDVLLLSEGVVDKVVVCQRNSLAVDLAISSLVDELSDGISAWVSVGDVWLNSSQHVDGGFVDSDEDSVVELSEPQESQNSNDLWVQLVDASDSDGEDELGLSWDVNGTAFFCLCYMTDCTFLLSSTSFL